MFVRRKDLELYLVVVVVSVSTKDVMVPVTMELYTVSVLLLSALSIAKISDVLTQCC